MIFNDQIDLFKSYLNLVNDGKKIGKHNKDNAIRGLYVQTFVIKASKLPEARVNMSFLFTRKYNKEKYYTQHTSKSTTKTELNHGKKIDENSPLEERSTHHGHSTVQRCPPSLCPLKRSGSKHKHPTFKMNPEKSFRIQY